MLSLQDIINVINVFRKNGASVLLITHREEISMMADRASQICNGRIICTGDPGNVAEYYKSRNVRLALKEYANMSELEELMTVFGESAGEKSILAQKDTAHLIVSGHNILSSRAVEGLVVKAEETASGISADIRVLEGTIIKNPVHVCFGILHKTGSQEIKMNILIENGASVRFIAHCIFPKAEKVRHIMDADVQVRENAEMRYSRFIITGLSEELK